MMESTALECTRQVFVKLEPSYKDAYVKREPSCSAVHEREFSYSGLCIEDDPSSVCEAAKAEGLYADHVVKHELILGPELVQPSHKDTAQGETQRNNHSEMLKQYGCEGYSYKTDKKAFVNHKRLYKPHIKKKILQCDHCKYTTSYKITLISHIKSHKQIPTGKKQCKCCKCNYMSCHKSHLKSHERIHSNEKPYKCGQCSYASRYKYSIKIHGSIHTGEKKYKCGKCSYTTRQRCHLKAHENIHTGKKPYKCGKCSYMTHQKSYLKGHEKVHNGKKPYKCGECSFATAYKSALNVHKKIHTTKKPGQRSYATWHENYLRIQERRGYILGNSHTTVVMLVPANVKCL